MINNNHSRDDNNNHHIILDVRRECTGSGLVLGEEGSAIEDVLSGIVGHVSAQGIAGEEPEFVPLYPWLMIQEGSLKNKIQPKRNKGHQQLRNSCGWASRTLALSPVACRQGKSSRGVPPGPPLRCHLCL